MSSAAPVLSVVVPVYNEEKLFEQNLRLIHDYLAGRGIEHEIVAVSNGSTDQTVALGKRMAGELDWLTFLALPQRGVGLAFQHGCRSAKGEIVVSIDLDLPSDIQFLEFAHNLRGSYDVLIGSKFMGFQQRSLLRVVGSQLYVLLAQLFFGLTVSDYSPDSKAFRRDLVLPILENLDLWTGYILEVALYARVRKRRVIQVSIDVNDTRPSGFNLLYEGYYRYRHFFVTWFSMRRKDSWLYG